MPHILYLILSHHKVQVKYFGLNTTEYIGDIVYLPLYHVSAIEGNFPWQLKHNPWDNT